MRLGILGLPCFTAEKRQRLDRKPIDFFFADDFRILELFFWICIEFRHVCIPPWNMVTSQHKALISTGLTVFWIRTTQGKPERVGTAQPGEEKCRGILSISILWRRLKDRVGLFLAVSSECTRGDGPQLKYKKFCLNMRKKLFHCKSGQILAQGAQRGYLDHLNYQKTQLDTPWAACFHLLCFDQGNELVPLQRWLHTSMILWCYEAAGDLSPSSAIPSWGCCRKGTF